MMTSRRRSPPRSDDATLTLEELAAKGREALVLLCDGLDLETAGPVSEYSPAAVPSLPPSGGEGILTNTASGYFAKNTIRS